MILHNSSEGEPQTGKISSTNCIILVESRGRSLTSQAEELTIEIEFRQYAELIQLAEALGMEPGVLTAIAKAMGAGKSAIEITKTMANLVGKTQNADLIDQMADLKLAMADLKGALADAKEEAATLQSENNHLRTRIDELEQPTVFLIKEGKFYQGARGEGPYCPQCWEDNKKLSLMSDIGMGNSKCSNEKCGFRDMAELKMSKPSGGFIL